MLDAMRSIVDQPIGHKRSISRIFVRLIIMLSLIALTLYLFYPSDESLSLIKEVQPKLQDGTTPTDLYERAKADLDAVRTAGDTLEQHNKTLDKAIAE